MTDQHPVTPPPDKVHNWLQLEKIGWTIDQIIALAAQWGADQELEECFQRQALLYGNRAANELQNARRPKPQSLKQVALADLDEIGSHYIGPGTAARIKNIRQALESIPDD